MNMKIINKDVQLSPPKRYSRKNYICSCLCLIMTENKIIDKTMVKYELTPNKNIIKPEKKKEKKYWKTWSTFQYWGKFKKRRGKW